MEEIILFFSSYGLVITIIAIIGITLLGVLKYCNVFAKIAESKRHYIYITISVGFSILATVVYLAVIGQLTLLYVLTVAAAIYALNQTFYNIFKVTPINELFTKILKFVIELCKKKKSSDNPTDNNKE